MKILKYIIFLLILIGIFSVIYRYSDENGFSRVSRALKTAIFVSACLAGLIEVEEIKYSKNNNNNQVYQERLLLSSDQEFNSFEGNDRTTILVKTGDSGSLSSSTPLPGIGQPSQFPTPPAAGRPSRPVYIPKHRILAKVISGAAANPAGAGNEGGGGNGGENTEFDDQNKIPKKNNQKNLLFMI